MTVLQCNTSQKGIELIKKFEGFRSHKYICAGGFETIGFGHRLLTGEDYSTISENCAHELLMRDLIKFERAVISNINVALNNNQFDALVSFTYNLGAAALQRSSLRRKINGEYFSEVPQEFLKWVYVGTKRLNGLILRRLAESKLFAGQL